MTYTKEEVRSKIQKCQIRAVDESIDRFIYELYRLSEKEIRIVKEIQGNHNKRLLKRLN
jgi:hypothetical protein